MPEWSQNLRPNTLARAMKRFDKILRISYRKDALKFKLKRLSQSFVCIVAVRSGG
jgi:hypothetical protein